MCSTTFVALVPVDSNNITDLQGKQGASSGAGHTGCTWQARVGTAGLPQGVCMNHRTQLCGGTVYSRDSSINTCCRRNAHSLQNLLQPWWRVEPTSPCTLPALPGRVSKNKTSAGAVPAGPGSKSAQGSDRGVTALLCYLWLCFQWCRGH